LECGRRRGAWFIEQPIRGRAADERIEQVLSVLEDLPRGEWVTVGQRRNRRLTLSDYGLVEPRGRIIFGVRQRPQEILVGNDTPLGNGVYVKLGDSEDVIATARSIVDILPVNVESFRDRVLVHGDPGAAERLEIHRPAGGFVQLTRAPDGWVMQQPVLAGADAKKVQRLLDALYDVRVLSFVWDPPSETRSAGLPPEGAGKADARVETYGLARDEATRVLVSSRGEDAGTELFLGKPVETNGAAVYARAGNSESVYAVARSVLDLLRVPTDELRDRNLFRLETAGVGYVCFEKRGARIVLIRKPDAGWQLMEPAQWKADDEIVGEVVRRIVGLQAESFPRPEAADLAAMGLSPPACIIEVAAAPPPSEPPPAPSAQEAGGAPRSTSRLFVGGPAPDVGTLYAMWAGGTILTVQERPIRDLGLEPAAPLFLRNRTMLSTRAASVWRLTRTKAGREQTVARDAGGVWRSAGGSNGVDQAAVNDVLFWTANLRASWVESHNPKDLAAYGLDGTGPVLTMGLSGEEGIQKSILLGGRAKPSGVYAMVQGQDVVFVLDEDVAEALTRDLLLSPSVP
jgi:hypothetical protein